MIEVRELHQSDHDDWRRLWDGYNAFYGRAGETALPEDVVRTTWLRLLDPSVPVHGLAGFLDGQMVAVAHESNVTAQGLYDQLAERPGFTLYLRTT